MPHASSIAIIYTAVCSNRTDYAAIVQHGDPESSLSSLAAAVAAVSVGEKTVVPAAATASKCKPEYMM